MKGFKQEFCFFSAFNSLNLLKQKDIQVIIFRQRKTKDSIYSLLIFFLFFFSHYLLLYL